MEEESESKLLKFPPEVLLKVCEDSGYQACQTLRKSNWGLRNLIDSFSPDPQIKSIQIRLEIYTEIHLLVKFFKEEDLDLRYTDLKNGKCSVVKDATKRTLKEAILEGNFIEIFAQDFDILQKSLVRQKIPIEELTIKSFVKKSSDFFKKFQETISSPKNLLEVTKLHLRIFDITEIMAVLPFLTPTVLKNIVVENSRKSRRNLSLMEIARTEVWRKAESVDIDHFTVKFPSRFLHFTKFHAEFVGVTLDDVRKLKEVFFATETPKMFKVDTFRSPLSELDCVNILGRDYTTHTIAWGVRVYRLQQPYGAQGKVAKMAVGHTKICFEMGCSEDLAADEWSRSLYDDHAVPVRFIL